MTSRVNWHGYMHAGMHRHTHALEWQACQVSWIRIIVSFYLPTQLKFKDAPTQVLMFRKLLYNILISIHCIAITASQAGVCVCIWCVYRLWHGWVWVECEQSACDRRGAGLVAMTAGWEAGDVTLSLSKPPTLIHLICHFSRQWETVCVCVVGACTAPRALCLLHLEGSSSFCISDQLTRPRTQSVHQPPVGLCCWIHGAEEEGTAWSSTSGICLQVSLTSLATV